MRHSTHHLNMSGCQESIRGECKKDDELKSNLNIGKEKQLHQLKSERDNWHDVIFQVLT